MIDNYGMKNGILMPYVVKYLPTAVLYYNIFKPNFPLASIYIFTSENYLGNTAIPQAC